MNKLVHGVGVNDLGYRAHVYEDVTKNGGKKVRKSVFLCKYYAAWKNMLERCYSKKYLERYPSYIGTSVCNEWLSATAFKKWMEKQDWHDKCLDKDIIAPGSKLYSPETCAFVLKATNLFVTARDACRGEYPIGVSLYKHTGKYRAHCGNLFTEKQEHLGYFSTPEDAHEAWRKRKDELAQLVAATESDLRVVEALKKRYSFEEWYKSITPRPEGRGFTRKLMKESPMSKDDVTKRFKPVWNLQLAVDQNIDQQGMEKLQELYNALGEVLDHPHRYPDPVATVERLEYALQKTWKFEEDSKMHRYWNQVRGCTCPQDDNFLALGTGLRYYNSSCKWHGVNHHGIQAEVSRAN